LSSLLKFVINMKAEKMERKVAIPEGVTVKYENDVLTVKGKLGENKKKLFKNTIAITIEDGVVTLTSLKATKREKMFQGTFESIIKSMIKGVSEGFEYKLKVCSSHFPMTVTTKENTLSVKNFLGEKIARTVKVPSSVKLKVSGDIIEVSGIDKAVVGAAAGKIEALTRITDRDRRRFQDGIYMIEKSGKQIIS